VIDTTTALTTAPAAGDCRAASPARPVEATRQGSPDLPRELTAALAVAATALCVDSALLWLLAARAGWPPVLAASISFLAGAFVNWVLSVRFVFRFRRCNSSAQEFVAFVAIGLVALALNDVVIATLIGPFGTSLMIAKGMAAGVTFSCNYGLRKALLFSAGRSAVTGSLGT
jgi:putative flippase GtrA